MVLGLQQSALMCLILVAAFIIEQRFESLSFSNHARGIGDQVVVKVFVASMLRASGEP